MLPVVHFEFHSKIAKKKFVSNGNEFKKCMQQVNAGPYISITQKYIDVISDQLNQAVDFLWQARAASTKNFLIFVDKHFVEISHSRVCDNSQNFIFSEKDAPVNPTRLISVRQTDLVEGF